MRVLVLLAALAAAAPLRADAPEAAADQSSVGTPAPDAAAALAALTRLAGTWRDAERPASPLRVHFYLVAGGTVLVEDWRRGDTPHSLTLYHRDGAALIATHYCPQGNQPRLELRMADAQLQFGLRDVTDLDSGESHQHALGFDLSNPSRPVRSETYRGPDGDEADTLTLVRVDGA